MMETADVLLPVQNPLMNQLILDKIMSYLDNIEDLKTLRLVHSTWKDPASKHLKKNSVINLSVDFIKKCQEEVGRSFVDKMGLFGPHNFILYPGNYEKKTTTVVKSLFRKLSQDVHSMSFKGERPIKICGQTLKEIVMANYLPNVTYFGLDSSFLFPNQFVVIPTVKEIYLKMEWKYFDSDNIDIKEEVKSILDYIFEVAPNLEKVTLADAEPDVRMSIGTGRYVEFRSPTKNVCLQYIINYPSLRSPHLKHLDLLNVELTKLDIEILCKLETQLKSLKFSHLPEMFGEYQAFELLMQYQKETLEILECGVSLTRYHKSTTPLIAFPTFPKLKTLKLVHEPLGRYANDYPEFEHVDYSTQFPILENLSIKSKPFPSGNYYDKPTDEIWISCPLYKTFLPVCPPDEENPEQICNTLRWLDLPYPGTHKKILHQGKPLFGIRERLGKMFPNVHNEHLDYGRMKLVSALAKSLRSKRAALVTAPVAQSQRETRRKLSK